MRSKTFLICLWLSLVVSGCTSSLVLELEPEFKSRASFHKLTAFPVEGLLSNDTIEFGKYKFINAKGVVKNRRSFIAFGFGDSTYEKHFSFQYSNEPTLWNAFCEDFVKSEYGMGEQYVLKQSYKCKMTHSSEENPSISFEFTSAFEGQIMIGDSEISVVTSANFEDEEDPNWNENSESFFQSLANTKYRSQLAGYLFMKEDKVIGALQSFREPTVWIDQQISPELQDGIALVSASYFVRVYLRGEDAQFHKIEERRWSN